MLTLTLNIFVCGGLFFLAVVALINAGRRI